MRHITLRSWSEYADDEREVIADLVAADFDTPIAERQNAHDLRRYLEEEKDGFWVILADAVPVGWFALGSIDNHPGYLQTTTYILSTQRRTGINKVLKPAVSQALLLAGVPLGAGVRGWNFGSQKAMANAFPEVTAERYLVDGQERFWYDLSDIDFVELRDEEVAVFDTVTRFAFEVVPHLRVVKEPATDIAR